MNTHCIFCDRSQLEDRIIFENSHYYVVATLGQITDGGYVLLISKEHGPCMAELTSFELDELSIIALEIISKISLEYKSPVTIFEHGIVGQSIQHFHLHFVPATLHLTQKIQSDFPEARIMKFQNYYNLAREYKGNPLPYLSWTNASGEWVVCWDPNAPPQYLRIITSDMLGRPERGNWKEMDPEMDKNLWKETVRRLKPHFNKAP